MKTMSWQPPGYGGERRDADRVKQDGWRDQGQLGEKLYGPRPRERDAQAP